MYFDLDMSYINDPNRIYPINYGKSVIGDLPDQFQMGHFGSNESNNLDRSDSIGKMWESNLDKFAHPESSSKYFLLKKWNKYTIYSKNGPQVRGDDPLLNLYSSNDIYLYELVSVSENFYSSIVYTSSFYSLSSSANVDPYGELVIIDGYNYYKHEQNTFKYRPQGSTVNSDNYFELFGGYPINHYTHKYQIFSPNRFQFLGKTGNIITSGSYIKSSQTIDTTIGKDGLNDGSLPVESIITSNVNVIQSDNVINA
jgi:hypothetical protein